ncbi:hypothetical protein [Halobellus rufus]|uniref:hypothetical protein n=1 Tax=Halobellus rufus TaxID=1448860 RepID=UPI0006787EF5|nr:hypothetical protein [Halobellus rufus]
MINNTDGGDSSESIDPRNDLTAIVDDYITALVAHNPGAAPIAPDADFVENIEPKTLGEGLWQTASEEPTSFEIYVPDPVAGQVGYLGLLKEDGDPVLLGLRLNVKDGTITEMEHMITRDLSPGRDGYNNLNNLDAPRQVFRQPVPKAERNTREELLKITDTYYDAVAEDDGCLAPFAANCVRIENGFQTTCKTPPPNPEPGDILLTLDAAEQLDAGTFSNITRIEPRRVEIADVETGLVCGLSHLRHPMEETTLDIEGVPEVETVERDWDPFDTVALHIFKISRGKIRTIEAVGFRAPYNSPTGWE